MAATAPAMPIIHWIRLMTIWLVSTQELVAEQSLIFLDPTRATRMAPMMILADMTMARPIKARARVFLPVATLPESPPEKI